MKKAIIVIFCVLLLLQVFPVMQTSAVYNAELRSIKHYSEVILLVSLDDSSVIFNKNADMPTPPASFTKVMTAILALEQTENLDEVVIVPEYTIRLLDNTNSSVAGIKPGEKMTVLNLLYCLLVKSANEAANILADYVSGGDIPAFIENMNMRARELGCVKTVFKNPHGLDEDGQTTTANDMLKIVTHALTLPVFETITSTTKYTIPATNLSPERKLDSTVLLTNKGYRDYYCEYASGIKTGSTGGAGRCVISRASKDAYSYLAIIMRGPFMDIDKDGINENCAFVDCREIFNWAFRNIRLQSLAKPTQILGEVPVALAKSVDHVQLVPKEEVLAYVPTGSDAGSVLIQIIEDTLVKEASAPIKKGAVLGQARVMYAEEEIARVDLVAATDVDRSTLLYAGASLKDIFSTLQVRIVLLLILLLVAAYAVLAVMVNIKKRKRKKLRVVNYRDVRRK